MSDLTILLAAAPAAPLSSNPSGWGRVPGLFQDVFLVVALGIVLLAILMALVFWTRRKRRPSRHSHSHRRHRHHHSSSSANPSHAPREDAEADAASESASSGAEDGGESHYHHRRRRRRRSHRGRNPTLAETGGLPPPRPEGQIPPSL